MTRASTYIVHKSLINNVNFILTIAVLYDILPEKITFDEKSRLINTNEPYVLVHQYKKWEVFSNHINRFKENL